MTDLLPARPMPLTRRPAPAQTRTVQWDSVLYKLLGALTAPVVGTIISAVSGPAWLTWLSLCVALLGVAGCFFALVMERRAYQRATRQRPHYVRSPR